MGEATWYTRSRGRIFGPFTRAQLESLRDRGQLTRFHEVSQDRQSWTSAASVSELFSQGEATPSQSPSNAYSLAGRAIPVYEAQEVAAEGPSAPAEGSSSWFYSQGGAHAGPVTFQDLQRMAAQGEIGPDSLVWKSGMAGWVVSRNFPDLVFPGPGRSHKRFGGSSTDLPRAGRTGLFEHTPTHKRSGDRQLGSGNPRSLWNRKSPRDHLRGRLPGPDLSIEWHLDG